MKDDGDDGRQVFDERKMMMLMCRRSMDYRRLPLVDSHRRGRSNQRCCAGRLNVSIFGLGISLGIQWASRRGGGLPGFNLKECKCVGDSNSSATQGIMLQMGVTREVSRALENQDSNVKKIEPKTQNYSKRKFNHAIKLVAKCNQTNK